MNLGYEMSPACILAICSFSLFGSHCPQDTLAFPWLHTGIFN